MRALCPREVSTDMELVVRKTDLLRELQLFQGIVERKNTIPILANVLIEADGDKVRLLATDLEVGLRSTCAAAVTKGGSLTLPAKKLYEIIKALPETDIRIEEDKNGVKVAADRFDSRMQTLPREDFPTLPDGTGVYSASLPRDVLKHMVSKTQFAITGEDTRYFLNGALFILRPDSMSLVSTDGHRLALITVPREKAGGKAKDQASGAKAKDPDKDKGKPDDEVRVILPRKTLMELGRLLAEGEGDIQYERGENHLFFEIGGRLLISRMIDGQFPAFERVIPKGNDKRIDFDRDRLTSAVKRVALLSNERSRAVKFQIDQGKVEIASSSPEFGEAKEALMVEYTGTPVTICFNAQYVLDFLSVVETDSVGLEFKDEMSQAVMKPIGADGYDYTYVIMPMRV
jgi:DNA polymerase III subunit beta